jgi:hypothetical protein
VTAEAAFITSNGFFLNVWTGSYRLNVNDPLDYQSICLDVSGVPAGTEVFRNGSSSRCGGTTFGGTPLFVRLPESFSGTVDMTVIMSVWSGFGQESLQEITRIRVVQFIAGPPPPPPPPGSRSLRVRAARWQGDEFGAFEPASGASLTATARVPLGAEVIFQAIDQDGVAVPAAFSFGPATLAPGVESRALFPGIALHRFTSAVSEELHVQAVHLGIVTVTVTPSDPEIAGGTIAIEVSAPERFGAAVSGFDSDIVKTAHRTGVPAHFIRGHVSKESGGNRMAYRYEPIGPTFGDLEYISRGETMRAQPPFEDYRLEFVADTASQIPFLQGEKTNIADINPRASLRINCAANGTGGNPIGTDIDHITNPLAWEIFRCNDAQQNWTRKAGKKATDRKKKLQNDPFTAQTTLAASYGLMQMMFGLAVEMDWRADDQTQNPSKLFDPPGAVDRGEGSLLAGSRHVGNLLRRLLRRSGAQLSNRNQFHLYSIAAWDRYNPGEEGYGFDIAGRVTGLQPVLIGPIIQP